MFVFLPAVQVTYANEAFLMYETDAFRSGIIAMLLLLPIVLPMKLRFFRNRVRELVSESTGRQIDIAYIPKSPTTHAVKEVLGCRLQQYTIIAV